MERKLNFVEYGSPEGKTVIYFHGAPGSPEECSIFDKYAKDNDLSIVCYDRFSINSSLQNNAYYKNLADVIIDKANGDQVDLIGFSIGCHAAIETSFYLEGRVRNIHLISAAAPLDADDFLEGMAGKMVFLMAMRYPAMFKLLSYWQALLAKLLPSILYKMLFASAAGEDKVLSEKGAFRDYMTPLLTHCYNANVRGYIREVRQYVMPWKESIHKCSVNTQIWHGTSDNWSPFSMAVYLEENMPASITLNSLDGLSHYTCLYAAAPQICSQLAEA